MEVRTKGPTTLGEIKPYNGWHKIGTTDIKTLFLT